MHPFGIKPSRPLLLLALASLTVVATFPFHAQSGTPSPPAAVDNSRQNARIPTAATAESQPNDRADRRTLAQVRKAIVADKALSVYAHNVKIIVVGGKVTLEGPVHSEDERQMLLADAASVVNPTSIVNRLTIPSNP